MSYSEGGTNQMMSLQAYRDQRGKENTHLFSVHCATQEKQCSLPHESINKDSTRR